MICLKDCRFIMLRRRLEKPPVRRRTRAAPSSPCGLCFSHGSFSIAASLELYGTEESLKINVK
ncbi:MAG: hypothetical protein LBF85_06615 [Tannerella sp.]|jgi:hypothetical protein|nr:hypothetical protein [Tannerella sp.]